MRWDHKIKGWTVGYSTACLISMTLVDAQTQASFDLLIQNGRLIDARNGIDGTMDVAVRGGRIAEVAERIDASRAERSVDAEGLLVVPGLVDLHAHVFYGVQPDSAYSDGTLALAPDGFTFRSGVTAVVDTGGTGWRDFDQFRRQVVETSKTRVFSMLNIVGRGMKGGPIEQDLNDMDPKLTAMKALANPETVVGIKLAHYEGEDWEPVRRAVAAARRAGLPLMVDFGRSEPNLPLETLFEEHLGAGDIFTHTYAHVTGRQPIVDANGLLEPSLAGARERGIVFDVGHGAGSFDFVQAVAAIEQGFVPDTISTDLHRASMNAGMQDLLSVASKFLNMGMAVEDLVVRMSFSAAQAIRKDDLGHLSVGTVADVAVLRVVEGDFGFVDIAGRRLSGTQRLVCELTLREGEIVWDRNGLGATQPVSPPSPGPSP